MRDSWRNALAGLAAALALAGAIAAAALLAPERIAEAYAIARGAARGALHELVVGNQLLSWKFYALLGFILLLERLWPVRPQQAPFSTAFVHDCAWFVFGACFIGAFMPFVWSLLQRGCDTYLSFLRVESIDLLPVALQIAIAVLLGDFVRWLHHLARHKITFFWSFHTVHHSQRDLNAFSDLRVHPVERIIETLVSFVPFFALNPRTAFPALAAWGAFGVWYARFYHGNVRTNLGPLRYVLVTPQSHRIHHSRRAEHRDTNFGAIFSIWDRLFGTQYRGDDEYPETGVDDPAFPHEGELGLRPIAAALARQLAYPFQLLSISARFPLWQRGIEGDLSD